LSFSIEGRGAGERGSQPSAGFNIVGTDYFRTLGISLVRGRAFAEADGSGAPFVAVINETMARTYWPGEDPIGKRFGADVWGKPAEVIGVARDSKYTTLGEEAKPFMFLPFAQHFSSDMVLQLQAAGAPEQLAASVRAQIRALAPSAPLANMRPLSQDMRVALLPARAGAGLLGTFGSLALLLAIGGVYGVASYTVAQRTREIGIRAALGAGAADLVRFVLAGSLRHVAIGIGAGLVVALGVGRLLSSFLYGVSGADPLTFVAVALCLSAAALVACATPARRATRVDPMVALRYE
jgi:putative ABC transport system permease protein